MDNSTGDDLDDDLDETPGESPRDARHARRERERARAEAAVRAAQEADNRRARDRAIKAARRSAGDAAASIAGRGQLASISEMRGRRPDVAGMWAALISSSYERVALLGNELAAAYEEGGIDALVREVSVVNPDTGELEPNGEVPTALVKLEAEERKHLAHLIATGARLSIEDRRNEIQAAQAAVLVSTLQAFAKRLGLDWSEQEVRRMAQSAVLEGRAVMQRQLER